MNNGIGTFKQLPRELTDSEMRDWLDAIGSYELVAHHTETPQGKSKTKKRVQGDLFKDVVGEEWL